jgi:hypothetical protein
MRKHYAAILQGQGVITRPLIRLWSSRFSGIRARVLVPEESERLDLIVKHNALTGHTVELLRYNWLTQQTSCLYHGPLTNGTHERPRNQRD